MAEIEACEGVKIGKSQLSKALRKNFRWRRPRHTLKGRQIAAEIERVGLRLQLRKAQAEAGDIILLYGDESEALTHPLSGAGVGRARCGPAGAGARTGQESGDDRLARSCHAPVDCAYEPDQAQQRLHRSPRAVRPPVRSPTGTGNNSQISKPARGWTVDNASPYFDFEEPGRC